eukprot:jgi/Botrbrau1/6064/Bobra.177_1s0004.1
MHPQHPLSCTKNTRSLQDGTLIPIGQEPVIQFNISNYRSVDITFHNQIYSNSSFPEITGTAQANFITMRYHAMRNLNYTVRWLMDVVHVSLDTGLPVISKLPLTQIETQWLVMKLEGPYLSPFSVEKQTALTAALQNLLLQKTNMFLLNITKVDAFESVPGYMDSINVTILVSKYESEFLPSLSEVLSDRGDGILVPKIGNRSEFIEGVVSEGLDIRRATLLSVSDYHGEPVSWKDQVVKYLEIVKGENSRRRIKITGISFTIGLFLSIALWRYRHRLPGVRRRFGTHEVYMGPLSDRPGTQMPLLTRESLQKAYSNTSEASRASSIPEPLWNDTEIRPNDVAIALLPNKQPWVLGSGAYGRVYKGLLKGVHEVAIKIFTIQVEDVDIAQTALSTEIAILRSCTNPYIVQFLGVSFKNHEVWMVMEYMDGGNLFNALKIGKENVRWQQGGKKIALDIARGLAWLHAHDVIHLDIKSPNILLKGDGAAKLGDVGLSRRLQNGRTHATLVDVGTYDWCAPEIILYQQATVKSDIFSYGVVLWEIITGNPPSRGRITEVNVPEQCCQATADLLRKCLSETPADRPTAAEIIIALSDTLGLPRPMLGEDSCSSTCDTVVDISSHAPKTNGTDISFIWRYQHSLPKVNPFAEMAKGQSHGFGEDLERANPFQAAAGVECATMSNSASSRGTAGRPTSPLKPLWSMSRNLFSEAAASTSVGGIGSGLSKSLSARSYDSRVGSGRGGSAGLLLPRRSDGGSSVDKKAS